MRGSIHVTDRTRRRLAAHKAHERETYDAVIDQVLDLLEEDDLEKGRAIPQAAEPVARAIPARPIQSHGPTR